MWGGGVHVSFNHDFAGDYFLHVDEEVVLIEESLCDGCPSIEVVQYFCAALLNSAPLLPLVAVIGGIS